MKLTTYKKVIDRTEYIDDDIKEIFIYIYQTKPEYRKNSAYGDFCIHYSTMRSSEISWNEMCDYVKSQKVSKFALIFFHELLVRKLYENEFAELFYTNIQFFDIKNYKKNDPLYWIFCREDINELILYRYISNKVLGEHNKRIYDNFTYIDDRLLSIVKEIFMENPKVTDRGGRNGVSAFYSKYSQLRIEEISWIELCDDAIKYKCNRQAFYIIYKLLKRNLYHNEYSEDLYKHMHDFERIYDGSFALNGQGAGAFLCGDKIEDLNIILMPNNKSVSFVFYSSKNRFLKDSFLQFYVNQRQVGSPWVQKEDIARNFEMSFNRYQLKIQGYHDFNEYTFWCKL